MTQTKTLRNVLIILVLAALVDLLPGGGPAANTTLQALTLAFLAAGAWIASRLYRERRETLYVLGTRRRAIAYSAAGVVMVTLTATQRLWASPAGSIAWIFLLVAAGYAVYGVYRSYREY